MDNKSITQSKTMWFAIATTVVSCLSLVAGEEWIQAYPTAVSVIGIVVGILTAVLRSVTKTAIK